MKLVQSVAQEYGRQYPFCENYIMLDVNGQMPTRDHERAWWAQDLHLVAGIDEVGRGPLAGPVVAGAVILPREGATPWIAALRDSKLLPFHRREQLAACIRAGAIAYAVGAVPASRIDEVGIARAAREAMRSAVSRLIPAPQALLIDAFLLPEVTLPQLPVVHGDALSSAVAAASIIAKVVRDRAMVGFHTRYPGYGFDHNRGYGTREHLEALQRLGPSPIHRRSFAPVRGGAAV